MQRVDFYVIDSQASRSRHDFACRLSEKAFRQGQRVYILVNSAQEQSEINELLWTFRDDSFVPHGDHESAHGATVSTGEAEDCRGLLINLSDRVPECAQRFERIAEVVISEPAVQSNSRNHFRFYREQGYDLHNHKIGNRAGAEQAPGHP